MLSAKKLKEKRIKYNALLLELLEELVMSENLRFNEALLALSFIAQDVDLLTEEPDITFKRVVKKLGELS